MLDQVIRAVEFLFGFTLAAGLVVLFAAVTRHARGARARVRGHARAGRAAASLLRAGAARRAGWASALLAGLLAQLVAIGGRLGAGALCVRFQLDRRRPGCRWSARWPARVLALAAGWWGLREVLSRPVVETLRQAAD